MNRSTSQSLIIGSPIVFPVNIVSDPPKNSQKYMLIELPKPPVAIRLSLEVHAVLQRDFVLRIQHIGLRGQHGIESGRKSRKTVQLRF